MRRMSSSGTEGDFRTVEPYLEWRFKSAGERKKRIRIVDENGIYFDAQEGGKYFKIAKETRPDFVRAPAFADLIFDSPH